METIRVTVTGNMITAEYDYPTTGSVESILCEFTFDEAWDGYSRTAVFFQTVEDPHFGVLGTTELQCNVPWEAIDEDKVLNIGVFGTKEGVLKKTSWVAVSLREGVPTDGVPEPTPDVYAQILTLVEQYRQDNVDVYESEDARQAAEIDRESAEGLRASAEADRATAEGLRVSAESDRETAEGLRDSAEADRVTAEGLRNTAEIDRATAEGLRVSAETQRNENENDRIAAENTRAAFYEGFQTAINEKTSYGVISGLSIGSVDVMGVWGVECSPGVVYTPNGVRHSIPPKVSNDIPVTPPDATYDRLDIIYVSSAGEVMCLAGTPAETPIQPATPSGGVLLATLLVQTTDTSPSGANITQRQKRLWRGVKIYPTLINGWSSVSGYRVWYMLDDFGEVHHGGRMQGGVPGSNPFQKPIGYRPPSNFNILLPTDSNTSIVRAQMASNGILYILSNYTNYVDISSLRYSIY